MKKNKCITNLVLSCLILSAGLLLNDQAFAAPAETTTTLQKVAQLNEATQKFSEQKNEKNKQLSVLKKKIQKIQLDLDQLEKIEYIGHVVESTEKSENHTVNLNLSFSPVILKDSRSSNPLEEKKERLTELRQQQEFLKTDTEIITKQQAEINKQHVQLADNLAQATKQQQTEQVTQIDTRSAVIAAAKTHLGKPYVYGAAGPDAFDCSGLVQVAFASAGHSLGRTTVDQELTGSTISVAEAQAGDLVFWGSHGESYHVGISTGDGSYIHAPVPGDVVQLATVTSYAPDFAVRVL